MNTKIGVAAAAVLLALTLTGCGNNTPTPVETKTPTPVEVVTPSPTETVPPAQEREGTTILRDENGALLLPNGEAADCPDGTPSVFINKEGVVTCDPGADW